MLAQALKPFASSCGKKWLLVGTASHVFGHGSDIVLNIPAPALLALYKNLHAFIAVIACTAPIFLALIAANTLQTYLFETLIAFKNLRKLTQNSETTALIESEEPIKIASYKKYIALCGALYTQGPYHGICSTPVFIVLLREILSSQPLSTQLAVIVPAATGLFSLTAYSNHKFEVDGALKNIKHIPAIINNPLQAAV